jgi:hypothetical protein
VATVVAHRGSGWGWGGEEEEEEREEEALTAKRQRHFWQGPTAAPQSHAALRTVPTTSIERRRVACLVRHGPEPSASKKRPQNL